MEPHTESENSFAMPHRSMRTGSSCHGFRQHVRRLTVAASPEAKAEAAGATADNVDGTVPTVEAAVVAAPLTVEVALLLLVGGTAPAVEATVAAAPLTVEVALLLLVGGAAPAVEAAVAGAPPTAGVTPDVDGTVIGATGTAVNGTVTGETGTAGTVGKTVAATVVAAVVTGTAVVSVPETTEAALLLIASATTLTKEPVSLVVSEMLVSPSEPKRTVWVELTKRTCWSPRVRSMASGVLAKRTVLFEDDGPSRMVLLSCRCSTFYLRLQHARYISGHALIQKRRKKKYNTRKTK